MTHDDARERVGYTPAMSAPRRLLVVCAHPDDEVLGCGGTVRRRVDEGWDAACVILTGGVGGRHGADEVETVAALQASLRQEAAAAHEVLGFGRVELLGFPDNRLDLVSRMDLARALKPLVAELRPDVILTHHPGDYNWDHTRTFDAVMMAARPDPSEHAPSELYTFEVNSSTERACQSADRVFMPNTWVDIERTIERKKEALRCYASELRPYPHPRSETALDALSRKRGTEVGLAHAEAFHLVRRVM